jgi:GNAT superfamily N-acetyltransferase
VINDYPISVLERGSDPSEAAALLIAFFAEEHFDTPPETIRRNLAEMLELDICRVYLARADGEAVGIATASLDYGIEFGWSCEVGDLYVLPRWRGRGIARALLDRCIAWSRERGATSLRVTVTPHGAHANLIPFYRRLGFSDDGRRLMAIAL